MIIKKSFELLAGVDNIIPYSERELKRYMVDNGSQRLTTVLDLLEDSVSHYTKKKIYKFLNEDKIYIVDIPTYKLPVSIIKGWNGFIINLAFYNADTITRDKPDTRALYASVVYGYILLNITTGKKKISESIAPSIIGFLSSMMISAFGKPYGLTGTFQHKIAILKYLTACYVYASFFGYSGNAVMKKAGNVINVAYNNNMDELSKYDFTKISEYVRAISESKVMPGFTIHEFTHRIYRSFGVPYLISMEDFSRFMATMAVSEISGNGYLPSGIKKYSKQNYTNILNAVKLMF